MNYPKEKAPKGWKRCCICKQYPDEYAMEPRKWWHFWTSIFCIPCSAHKYKAERFQAA